MSDSGTTLLIDAGRWSVFFRGSVGRSDRGTFHPRMTVRASGQTSSQSPGIGEGSLVALIGRLLSHIISLRGLGYRFDV